MVGDRKAPKSLEVEIGSIPVLFRVWIYNTEASSRGVIDIEYPLNEEDPGTTFFDALENIVQLDDDGVLRLYPRNRGRDIPEEWRALIESRLLAPVSVGSIQPWAGHVYGEGELCEIGDLKFRFTEKRLRNIKIISPLEHAQRKGTQDFRDDWPDDYSKRRKVFLCHSSKDKRFARKLADALERNGVDVWVDDQDILTGQDFLERIQEGISQSDFTAVILTPNFLAGPWANAELKMAVQKEVSEGRVNVLPILRIDCDIPRILGTKNMADFRGRRFDTSLKRLLHSISRLP